MLWTSEAELTQRTKPIPDDGLLYKAIRPDGTDFRTGRVQWAPPEGHKGTWIVKHPWLTRSEEGDRTVKRADPSGASAAYYLSASVTPLELPGSQWPMRMLRLRSLGRTGRHWDYPGKVSAIKFEVVDEIDPTIRFGPQGALVAMLIKRFDVEPSYRNKRRSTWYVGNEKGYKSGSIPTWATYDNIMAAVRRTGRHEAWSQAVERNGGSGHFSNAIMALMTRDQIGITDDLGHRMTQHDYDRYSAAWRLAYGPIHPLDTDPLVGYGEIVEPEIREAKW